jgi:hypothetical protein
MKMVERLFETAAVPLCAFFMTLSAGVAYGAPDAKNASYTFVEGAEPLSIYLSTSKTSGSRTYALTSLPSVGTLSLYRSSQQTPSPPLELGESFTSSRVYYEPTTGFTGKVSFKWTVTDESETTSNVATVTIAVEANVAPVAVDQNAIVVADRTTPIGLIVSDQNTSHRGRLIPEVVTPPEHGKATASSYRIQYTPDPGFTGIDRFSWRASDGIAPSNEATATILVRRPGDRATALVLIVAEAKLLPELETEVERLQNDLIDDGYTARIVSFSGSASELWSLLRKEYTTPGQFLTGAIFVGRLPTAKATANSMQAKSFSTDYYYWCLAQKGLTSSSMRNIWVSRFNGRGGTREVQSLRWSLQANHDYRTGKHRLPRTGFHWAVRQFSSEARKARETAAMLEVWPDASYLENHEAWRSGGDVLKSLMHGSQLSGQMNKMSGHPFQVRFNCPSSCSRGRLGSSANQMVFSRGGGAVFSVGATTTTYVGAFDFLLSSRKTFRELLAAGDSWGMAAVQRYPFNDYARAIYYGDLSLGAMAAPANEVPTITSVTADTGKGMAPVTVELEGQASDSDGTIAGYEWFCEGYGGGFGPVTHTKENRHTCRYTLAHRYAPELQVIDDYKARAWSSTKVVVTPDPSAPLRVQVGTASGSQSSAVRGADYVDERGYIWMHEQKDSDDGTWGVKIAGRSTTHEIKGTLDIAKTEDDKLFRSYRAAKKDVTLTYRFPLGDGEFTVWLGLIEPDRKVLSGQRLLDANIEEQSWLQAYDTRAAVGAALEAVWVAKTVTVADGALTLTLTANAASDRPAVLAAIAVAPGVHDAHVLPTGGPQQRMEEALPVDGVPPSDRDETLSPPDGAQPTEGNADLILPASEDPAGWDPLPADSAPQAGRDAREVIDGATVSHGSAVADPQSRAGASAVERTQRDDAQLTGGCALAHSPSPPVLGLVALVVVLFGARRSRRRPRRVRSASRQASR